MSFYYSNVPSDHSPSCDDATFTDTTSQLLSALSDITNIKSTGIAPRYLVHTSSVPLCTVFTNHYSNSVEVTHSCNNCMYQGRLKRSPEKIHQNCPCRQLGLEYVCFSDFLLSLVPNLRKTERTGEIYSKPEEYTFCPDAESITSNAYPASVKNPTRVSSWDNLTAENFHEVFLHLYWYSKHHEEFRLKSKIKRLFGIPKGRDELKQILFTIDGLIIKQFLALPDFQDTYSKLAHSTAGMFSSLIKDYLALDKIDPDTGKVLEPEDSSYKKLADYFDYVKETFHNDSNFVRMDVFVRDKIVNFILGDALQKLEEWIKEYWSDYEEDYTETLGWYHRMMIISQKRNMGYLPYNLSNYKMEEYITTLTTPIEIPDEEISFACNMLEKGLQSIPNNIFADEAKAVPQIEEISNLIDQVVLNSEFTLKDTASISNTRERGGKLEDARLIIRLLIDTKTQLPRYDLKTGSIIDYYDCSLLEQTEEIDEIIFWYSYQVSVNYLIEKELWDPSFFYHLPYSEDKYFPNYKKLMDSQLLKIREPGKDRFLIKTNALLAWVLTPCAKQTQGILAFLEEHREGLIGTAHAWKFYQAISPENVQAEFMYNRNRQLKDSIYCFFTDWSKASDYLDRRLGISLFSTFLDHVCYPRFYGELVLTLLTEDLTMNYRRVRFRNNLLEERSEIRRGFMMGNPCTKTILHLMHIAFLTIAREHGNHYKTVRKFINPNSIFNFTLPKGNVKTFRSENLHDNFSQNEVSHP